LSGAELAAGLEKLEESPHWYAPSERMAILAEAARRLRASDPPPEPVRKVSPYQARLDAALALVLEHHPLTVSNRTSLEGRTIHWRTARTLREQREIKTIIAPDLLHLWAIPRQPEE